MSAQNQPDQDPHDEENDMLDDEDIEEEIPADEDAHMDSDPDDDDDAPLEELQLENDSVTYFDKHTDSIFSIAQHPKHPQIIATGGGDDVAYVFDATAPPAPVLPESWRSTPTEREGLKSLAKLEGHKDSVSAITFTLPDGEFLVTAGLDGQLRSYQHNGTSGDQQWTLSGSTQEVEEINWLAPCPHPQYPNTVALGASDGSVWVYTVSEDQASPLSIVQAYYLHTGSCTAGSWSTSGSLLATVSEDGSLYVWDVFGDAAAAGVGPSGGGQAVVGLTGADERFRVESGLYSVGISPGGAFVAVGGGEGQVHVVGLPRLGGEKPGATAGAKGAGAKSKAGGGKQAGGPKAGGPSGTSAAGQGQAGQILASLHTQSESVEGISFSQPPLTLMATASVDGSIALYDCAHRFAVRRHIKEAHEGESVIKVDFERGGGGNATASDNSAGWLLTSCGNDGVVRRWDTRGGTAAAASGLQTEWRGHRGGGEGGGVLGFVQSGDTIITAGDDSVALVFPKATST